MGGNGEHDAVGASFRGRHLWLVQLIEYALGFITASAAINADRRVGLLLVSAAVIANATSVRAPLAAFALTSARFHRNAGLFIAIMALVVAFVVPMSLSARSVIVAVAVAQGALSVRFGHGF